MFQNTQNWYGSCCPEHTAFRSRLSSDDWYLSWLICIPILECIFSSIPKVQSNYVPKIKSIMVANGKLWVSWVDLVCLVIKKRLEHYIHKHSNQVSQKPIKVPNLRDSTAWLHLPTIGVTTACPSQVSVQGLTSLLTHKRTLQTTDHNAADNQTNRWKKHQKLTLIHTNWTH